MTFHVSLFHFASCLCANGLHEYIEISKRSHYPCVERIIKKNKALWNSAPMVDTCLARDILSFLHHRMTLELRGCYTKSTNHLSTVTRATWYYPLGNHNMNTGSQMHGTWQTYPELHREANSIGRTTLTSYLCTRFLVSQLLGRFL